MYVKFFGLKQEPFSIAPDPHYLYMSERHREALAHLLYGIGSGGGFVLLSGEIGAGKTTVCRCFLEQIPKRCNVAYIFNPKLTVIELLKSICDEFRIPYAELEPGHATVKDFIDPLNEFLLRTHAVGQNNVLIIDEAQNLSADVLEQLRLLTNLETNERKLLQIILIGQPELRQMLARPELEQLAQRVIARFHLNALTEPETSRYIRHRLTVAGLSSMPFDRDARRRIHQLARGVPRRINLLCDRALLGAYANGTTKIDRKIVEQAAREVFGRVEPAPRSSPGWQRRAGIGLAALSVATMAVLGAWTFSGSGHGDDVAPPRAASAPARPASASALAAARPASAAASAPALPAAVPRPLARTEDEAWRELAPLWNLALADGGSPCREAEQNGVLCHRSSGNLAEIRQLGRPGILKLKDQNGQDVYALLTGLNGQSATLRMGGVRQTVPLMSLARVWSGEFATFWRVPPGYRTEGVPPRSGPTVDWLATQLARVSGAPAPAAGQSFDAALKARLQEFQVAQGLAADGVPGPKTLMHLSRAAGVDEPRLITDPS